MSLMSVMGQQTCEQNIPDSVFIELPNGGYEVVAWADLSLAEQQVYLQQLLSQSDSVQFGLPGPTNHRPWSNKSRPGRRGRGGG